MSWGYDGHGGYGVIAPTPTTSVVVPSGNVICAVCWEQWLRDGTRWLTKPVTTVTIHEGRAMCEEHFRTAVGLSDPSTGGQ